MSNKNTFISEPVFYKLNLSLVSDESKGLQKNIAKACKGIQSKEDNYIPFRIHD